MVYVDRRARSVPEQHRGGLGKMDEAGVDDTSDVERSRHGAVGHRVRTSMTPEHPTAPAAIRYSGADILDVMAFAENYNRSLVELVIANVPKTGKVLDFGAGIGTFDDVLRKEGYAVECLEVDDGMAEMLESKGYVVWQALEEIPPGSVSHVFSFNVLEHIEDDAGAIRGLLPALAPRGRVVVYVPAFQVLFSSMDRKVGHFRRYRKASMTQLFESNGYRVQSARYADCVG